MGEYGDQKTAKEIMILLSSRVRDLRKNESMSQKELSEKSGVAYASVRKFESTGVISFESFLKICDALNYLAEFEILLIPSDIKRKKDLFDY
jgi:transcriptional regulator with XRE-family HTH domain